MRISRVLPRLDPRPPAPSIGVIAPFDFVLDEECRRWVPEGVALHVTRTPYEEVPVSTEMAMGLSDHQVVAGAVGELLMAEPAVIAYACTSGSFVNGPSGEEKLRRVMEDAGARQAVTTSGALLEALRALRVRRVAVGTPYDRALTEAQAVFLEEAGFEVPSAAYLDLTADISRTLPDSVAVLAERADHPRAEAVFLACTNLRTFDVLPHIERRLGKPALSANQVTMWASLGRAGVEPPPLDQALFRLT